MGYITAHFLTVAANLQAISLAQHAPTWPVKATATLMNAAVSACEKSAQWRSALAMSHEVSSKLIATIELVTNIMRKIAKMRMFFFSPKMFEVLNMTRL